MTTIRPRRVAARLDPQDWSADELMTLAEAAALLWPSGPLTMILQLRHQQSVGG
jgi:hypothetical protein